MSRWAVWVLPPESRRSSALLAIRLSKMADIRRWEMMLRLMPSSANTDRRIRDPVPFWPPGSERSGMGKKTRSGSEIPIRDEHHGSYFREIRNFFGGLKIFKFFDADQEYCIFDLGSGIRDGKIRIRDPRINIPDPQHCYPMFQLGIFLNWQIYRWRTDTLWIKCPQGDHLTLQAIGYFYIQ